MSRYDLDIVHYLGNRLIELYCKKSLSVAGMDKLSLQEFLLNPIHDYWKIDHGHLPGNGACYRVFYKHGSLTGMKEKLAVLYYAFVDEECRSKMPRLYLSIAKKQRMSVTPYWDRFVAEYKTMKRGTPRAALPPHPVEWVKGLHPVDLLELCGIVVKVVEMKVGKRKRRRR